MNCTLIMFENVKSGKNGKESKIHIGSASYKNGIAKFTGTPYSMGKHTDFFLKDAKLLRMTDVVHDGMSHGCSITFQGKMNGNITKWCITPRK